MSRFVSRSLPLEGLQLLERKKIADDRGFLSRLFCAEELAASGWHEPIAQISHTYTKQRGTVRGLHFQYPPHAEMKLVSVMRGQLWDVAVDLRQDSPTYLEWHAETLSADNNLALLIPEGFAHGFQAMTEDVEILYCHSAAHNAEAEGGLNPLDSAMDIRWPLAISQMSPRDKNHPVIDNEFTGL
ncbi:MAG: dTDP-4-dehydrorhamnose 3,5-epimerase family protein [Halioglobus sp.]